MRATTAAIRRCVAGGLIGLTALSIADAGSIRQARGLYLPIFAEGKGHPVAAIHIERVYRDHRRLGFFKVKALPVLVAEGVRLQVREPAGATNLLVELTRALQGLAGHQNFEVRKLQIQVGPDARPGLEAQRLYPPADSGSAIFGLQEVLLQGEQYHIRLPQAAAYMARPGVVRLLSPHAPVLEFD